MPYTTQEQRLLDCGWIDNGDGMWILTRALTINNSQHYPVGLRRNAEEATQIELSRPHGATRDALPHEVAAIRTQIRDRRRAAVEQDDDQLILQQGRPFIQLPTHQQLTGSPLLHRDERGFPTLRTGDPTLATPTPLTPFGHPQSGHHTTAVPSPNAPATETFKPVQHDEHGHVITTQPVVLSDAHKKDVADETERLRLVEVDRLARLAAESKK